jgi:hypothetical protein
MVVTMATNQRVNNMIQTTGDVMTSLAEKTDAATRIYLIRLLRQASREHGTDPDRHDEIALEQAKENGWVRPVAEGGGNFGITEKGKSALKSMEVDQ